MNQQRPAVAGTDIARIKKRVGAIKEHYRMPEHDLPQLDFEIRYYENADQLEEIYPKWSRLTEVAVQENPFFDPDFLIPAIRHLGTKDVKLLTVDAANRKNPKADRVLCAILPLIKKRFYGLPISCNEIWSHLHCFDQTPLIRHDVRLEVLTFIIEHLEKTGTGLFSLDTISNEGAFGKLLTEILHRKEMKSFHRDSFNRACFLPMSDPETYIRSKVSKNTRKSTKRLQRKLEESGQLELCSYFSKKDAETWIDQFLELEDSGWKGENGTAMKRNPKEESFFREMAKRCIDANKMSMTQVIFNDKPIGMLCDLHQNDYGIAFKTAFDESFSDYSPGLIAELNNIHRLHEVGVQKMDSCATPNHSMINRVWPDRIRFQSLVLATGGNLSKLAVAMMPLMQTVGGMLKGNNG